MRICLSLQISRLFFCNAVRRSYEFQKQTGRNANPPFAVYNGCSPDAVFTCTVSLQLNALLSRKIGEHKAEEACQAATTGLFLILLTSLIFSLAGIFFSDTIASKMATDPELQALCKQYLSINLVYCWGIFLQTYAQRLLQAVGDELKEHLYRDHGFRIQCSGDMLHEICRIIHLIDTGTVIRQAIAPDSMTATSWNRNWELRMISRVYCCV